MRAPACARRAAAGLVAALLASGLGGGCRAPAAPPVSAALTLPPFELTDQEGRRHRYAGDGTRPTVLIVGDRHASETNILWDHWLSARFGATIEIHRIVHLAGIPRLFETLVVNGIREGADPPGTPILLDWDGQIAAALDLAMDSTHVVIADSTGAVRYGLQGAPDERSRERVARELAALLETEHR